MHCETHQLDNDKNVVEKKCDKCKFMFYIATGNLCNDCENWETKGMHKAKENRIRDFLIDNRISFTQDKQIWKGCSKRRPDFVIDCGTHYIFLEVDENRHHDYDCYREQIRMEKIHLDVKLMRSIFIRYNPDSYINHLEEKIHYGLINPEREARLLKLIKSIQMHIPNFELTIIFLYYDKDDGKDIINVVDLEKNINTIVDDINESFQEKLVL